ncbi:MAG: TonB-dependent receptor, partial [Chitinophagaceae bacterium]|nr:TonB-dependent receptor [Chitinophagaceae bacterium]
DASADYQVIDNWQPYTKDYLGTIGYNPSNLYNPDYSWAVNKKLEIGLELGFFNNRLLVNTAWYRNRCGNQLIAYQ